MTKTITDIVFETLSRHFELTVNGVYKHCAGQPGITNIKNVGNALDRLRKQGRATSYRCEDRGIYLWQAVKPGQQAVDPGEESLDKADDQLADASNMMGEMASDVAELDQPQPVINESLTTEAVAEESSDAVKESLTVETPETFTDTWTKPLAVEFKAAVKLTPMSVSQAMTEYYSCGYEKEDLQAFLAGIEFAEKHHGIG